MKNVTKIVLAVVAAVTTMLQVPSVHNLVIAAIAAHPDVAALAAGLSTVLALLHDPNPPIAQITQIQDGKGQGQGGSKSEKSASPADPNPPMAQITQIQDGKGQGQGGSKSEKSA